MSKTVLITGTRSGLGKALREIFSENNWNVIATTKDDLDIADEKSIDNFVKKLDKQPIDILINNAAIYDAPVENDDAVISTINDITRVLKTNTVGPTVLTEKLLTNLIAGQEKLVVTISSIMSSYADLNDYNAAHWPYSVSKAALNFAIISFNKRNPEIKIVLIHPGWMNTKLGGKNAPFTPKESAEKIFNLIKDHRHKLPNGKLIDNEGKLLQLI